MFTSWMKVTLMTLQEMHMSRSLLCDYKSACKGVFFSVLDGVWHGSCIDGGDCCSQGTAATLVSCLASPVVGMCSWWEH
jgi:hypothetical protein